MGEEQEKRITPMKAIRAKCLDCCLGSAYEVRLCTAKDCPLWEFRSGHNPYDKRRGVSKTPPWMNRTQSDTLETATNTAQTDEDGECVE